MPNHAAEIIAYWAAMAPFWLPLWLFTAVAWSLVRRFRPRK